MARCKVCPAEIVWAVSEKGIPMPVDVQPVSGGTILLIHEAMGKPPRAHVTTTEEREQLAREQEYRVRQGMEQGPMRLFIAHHFTCTGVRRVRGGEHAGQQTLL